MSLRLFSATSAYFCNLKSEWPQIFKKWCSLTDSKMVGNRCLANSNAFYVKQLWRISEIALASPKPNMSYFITYLNIPLIVYVWKRQTPFYLNFIYFNITIVWFEFISIKLSTFWHVFEGNKMFLYQCYLYLTVFILVKL